MKHVLNKYGKIIVVLVVICCILWFSTSTRDSQLPDVIAKSSRPHINLNIVEQHRTEHQNNVKTASNRLTIPLIKKAALPRTTEVTKARSQFEIISAEAKALGKRYTIVFLLFLNEGFLEMTKNFVCNLKVADSKSAQVLQRIIFVTTQQTTADKLAKFDPSLNVLSQRYAGDQGSVSYGSSAYYKLTLERLKLQQDLLVAGINVFIIESDATWFDGESTIKRLEDGFGKYDIVSADDRGNHLISAGFSGVSASSEKAVSFFTQYVDGYTKKMAKIKTNDNTNIGDQGEQMMMTRLLAKTKLSIDWLDQCHFMRGQWYSSHGLRDNCPKPWVLQNNWIIGNAAKISRAKKWGYWYLNDDSSRCKA